MKTLRALLLILALSATAFAGDMPCGRDDGNQGAGGRAGEMQAGKPTAIDSMTVTALQILQSILPLI
jgi:hypothetical protein